MVIGQITTSVLTMAKNFLGTKLAVLSSHGLFVSNRSVSVVRLNPIVQVSLCRQKPSFSHQQASRFCLKSNPCAGDSAVTVQTCTPYMKGELSDVTELVRNHAVDVIGYGKGHGFAGVVARYGFGRGPMTRGSTHHRAPGSLGAGTFPARVYPKKKMPGRWGTRKGTYKNIRVAKLDVRLGLMWLEGNVPGKKGHLLRILPGRVSDGAGNQT